MRKWISIIITFIFFSFASCALDKESRKIRRETIKDNTGGVRFIASTRGNKDTINCYLVFYENHHFGYFEKPRHSRNLFGRMKYYAGQYEEKQDTIFLTYYDNVQSSQMADFLIKDSLRVLLLYPYKDGMNKLYLIPKKLSPDNKGLIRGM